MARYDDIVEQNKKYLTQAQIQALANASTQYNAQNAGNRAGALATAREQYDTGYRGLQNMGLAGAGQPMSGEVPRLERQIRTPFEDYNQRLQDVEHMRLSALGSGMAQQTQAEMAAEAERQRQAAEEARRQAEYQRAVAAAQALVTNVRNSVTPSWLQKTTDAVKSVAAKAAAKAQNDGIKRTEQLKQQAQQQAVAAANKYQQDGMNRTARPQDIAAAAAFNIAHYAQTTVAERANADQERGIKLTEKLKGSADSSNANKYYNGPNNTAFSQSEADAEYKSAQQTLDNLKLKQHYGGKVSEEEMAAAQNAALIAKVKAEDPEYYSAINTVNSTTATPDAKRKANMVITDRSTTEAVNAMGYKSTMSSAQFDDVSKVIPDLRMQLNIIDSTRNRMSNGGTGGQKTIDEAIAELEKHGYTEQETRELVKQFDDERYFRREYDYLNNAYTALYEHQGEKPEKPLNSKEMNPTYWAVNGNVDPEGKTLRNIGKSSTKAIAMRVEEFMTQKQRDAYNAIYEKDGIKAANAYAQAIKPFLEMQAAEADRKYFEEFASDESWLKRFQAWAFARGSNLLGSVPAMAEKLIVNGQNIVQEGKTNGTGVLKKYSPDSNISRMSNWADIVQTKQSKNILEKYDKQNRPGMGKFVNFMYNTGTSMADSMIAMGVSGALGSWATDILFMSNAGNQAYKDAIDRGATQEQAMGLAFLSGTAEALFEHVSLEKLTQTLKFKGKPIIQAVKDALTQAGVEGSEEFFTEIANVLSDFAIMKDKSEMQEAINNGELGKFLWEHLSSATIGGLASGLLFGLAGVGGAALSQAKDSKAKSSLGSKVRENSNVQQVKNTAILLGGEAMQQAEQVQKHETDANVGEMTVTVLNEIQSLGEELNQDQQVGLARILDGSEMTAEEAKDVHELLGKETLEKFSYDAATPEAFQKSYNDRLQKHNVTSRAEAMQQAAEKRFNKQKKEAASRVWANPEQGLSITTPEGGAVRPMPGNMTAVALAEQERTGFKTRASAVKGNVTYAVAGMEARQGLSNERTYSEIQKGLTKEARQKAQIYEKLADALGVKMVIHDVMVGTNGFIDEKGNMHVVLSGKQSVLRVAAHELTHFMKEHAGTEYASMREYLIGEVGQAKFDKLVKQKAKEYGLNLDTEKGRAVADDEVCAELCERMLSNEDSLTRFAEKDTKAAKTLKAHLLEILNAIKSAFKQAENRDFGASKSELIESQETLESWITGLQKAIENAETKAETAADEARAKQFQANEALYITEEDAKASRAQAKLQSEVEADIKRGTSVSGYDADTINGIIRSTLDTVGGETVLSKDALKQARARIAQTVRTAEAFLLDTENDAKQQALNDRTRQVATEIVDAYKATEGENAGALAELKDFLIGSDKTVVIGIGPNQMADIRSQYESPMVLQGKLAKALGARVQLVGKTNAKYESAWKMDELYEQLREKYNLSDDQSFTSDAQNLVDFIDGIRQQDEGVTAGIGDSETREQAILDVQQALMDQVLKAAGAKTGVEFSLDIEHPQFDKETDALYNNSETKYREYMTPEAIEKYSRDPRFAKWVHKDLAFITAAAWDGIQIPAEELLKIPKIAEAQRRVGAFTQDTMSQYPVGKDAWRDHQRMVFANRLLDKNHGSAVFENGKLKKVNKQGVYTGPVKQERHAAIVIGRPAGGKSSVFADPLSNRMQARIIDSDTVKPWFTEEYDGGYGAGRVQRESAYVADEAFKKAVANGDNIVLPRIGGESVIKLAQDLKNQGYTVDLYYNDVSEGSSVMRAASRFAEEGRYLDIGYLTSIKDKPFRTFQKYAESEVFDHAEWKSNDVAFGQKPIEIWTKGEGRLSEAIQRNNARLGQASLRDESASGRDRLYDGRTTANGSETGQRHSLDLDAQDQEYTSIADKYTAGTATKAETEKLNQMVKRAADQAGYVLSVYHGTRADFNRFQLGEQGIHLGTKEQAEHAAGVSVPIWRGGELVKSYKTKDAGRVMQLYAKMANPFVINGDTGYWSPAAIAKVLLARNEGRTWLPSYDWEESIDITGSDLSLSKEQQKALEGVKSKAVTGEKAWDTVSSILNDAGYDGIQYRNWYEGDNNSYSYIALKPSDVKLADPVTYDDAGNVIPLSERFNTQKDDIRYDLDTELLEEIQQPAEDIVTRYSLDTQHKRRSGGGNATPPPKKPPVDGSKKPGYKQQGKEHRVRDVQVPERAKTGDRVSDFVRSFFESDKASDEIVAQLMEKVEDGDWGTYTQLTNEDAMDRAKGYIARKQFTEAQADFHAMVASGEYNVHTRALGLQLLTEAANRGDAASVLDIATDLRTIATDAGQSLQIFSVMKELGGVGAGWYMQKEIDRLNTKYADEIASGKMNEITVDPELMQQLIQATTQADIEVAEDAIAEQVAGQLPLTTKSKIDNWRYLSMLGNPTTHFRNLTGNVFMAGLNAAKDVVATGIERVAVKDQSERAHAILNKKDRQMWKDVASQSFQEQERNLRGSGKNGFGSFIQQHMRSFDNKTLNAIAQGSKNGKNVLTRNGVMGMLEVEDVWFLRPAYQNAFMQYMKAQGFTVQDGKVGKMNNGVFTEITTAEMSKAIDWASQQAWKATFRDASTIASILNSASKKLGPVGHVLIEGVMPFKKTPVNIAKRGIEYSPVGVIMGTVQMMRDVKKGKMTAAQAIDNIASGVVGTSLMALGMAMAKAGLLRAGGDDEKKEANYMYDTGDQTYALKLGDVSVSVSALAPAAIPLLMGAALYEAMDRSEGGADLSSVTETVAGTLDPFMEMSVVSSLNSALKNYNQNGIGGALGNTILTAIESYGSQFLPTVTGKVGQFIDPTVRTTKSSAASKIGSNLDYYARSLAKKVPGLESTLEPDINVWGRETSKGNPLTLDGFGRWALDFANKFLLPVNVKIANRDAVDSELIRVMESTNNVNILPSDGAKYFTVKGQRYNMTAEQYTEFSRDRGQASYAALKETMASKAYQNASDEQKATMLENALSTAQKQVNNMWKERLGAVEEAEASEQDTVKTMKGDYSDPALYAVAANYPNAYDKAAKAKAKGVSPDTFLDLYGKKESYVGDDRADYMRKQIMSSNLTKQQKELMDDLIISDKGQNPDYSSQAWFDVSMLGKTNYDKAKKGEKLGITPETYLAVYNKSKEINAAKLGKKKKPTVTSYLDSLKLSATAYDYLMANVFGYTR